MCISALSWAAESIGGEDEVFCSATRGHWGAIRQHARLVGPGGLVCRPLLRATYLSSCFDVGPAGSDGEAGDVRRHRDRVGPLSTRTRPRIDGLWHQALGRHSILRLSPVDSIYRLRYLPRPCLHPLPSPPLAPAAKRLVRPVRLGLAGQRVGTVSGMREGSRGKV